MIKQTSDELFKNFICAARTLGIIMLAAAIWVGVI